MNRDKKQHGAASSHTTPAKKTFQILDGEFRVGFFYTLVRRPSSNMKTIKKAVKHLAVTSTIQLLIVGLSLLVLTSPVASAEPSKESYLSLGLAKFNEGDYQKAAESYTKALALDPSYVEALNNRGNTYNQMGQYEKAMKDLDKATVLDPSNSLHYINRGYVHYNKQEYQKAIVDYDKALSINHDSSDAHLNRGTAFDQIGEYSKAIADFNAAIKINPKDADAYNNRGFVYAARLRQYENATKDFDKAIELNPNLGKAYTNRGVVNQALGKTQKAISDFKKACNFGIDNACRNLQILHEE